MKNILNKPFYLYLCYIKKKQGYKMQKNYKKLVLIFILFMYSVVSAKEMNPAYIKWGKQYNISPYVLKDLAIKATNENNEYKEDIGMGYKLVGIMAIGTYLTKEDIPFLENMKEEDISKESLNVRIAAYRLSKCIKVYKETSTAIRCYNEDISLEEAKKISLKFKMRIIKDALGI